MQEAVRAAPLRVSAVLFDMDNTLLDFSGAMRTACEAVCGLLGTGRAGDLYALFLRDGGRSIEDHEVHVREFAGGHGVSSAGLLATACRLYEEVLLGSLAPYPGVRETLRALRERGLFLSVVTDARRKNAEARLERAGLSGFFPLVVTAEDAGARKPNPAIFSHAVRLLSVPPSRVLVVGDSLRRDIAPAKAIGARTAHARYGDRNAHEDGGGVTADVTLSDIRDLLAVVAGVGEGEGGGSMVPVGIPGCGSRVGTVPRDDRRAG
ncbi:MAG: HAD family hydrolase [Methanolinea sp.]|nr:HAD family hydrolase [Methanolinea sp.]